MQSLRTWILLVLTVLDTIIDPATAWVSASSPSSKSTSSSTRLDGVATTLRRARDSILNRERSREDLKIGIAGFYDRSSQLWEEVWGEVCVCLCVFLLSFFITLAYLALWANVRFPFFFHSSSTIKILSL